MTAYLGKCTCGYAEKMRKLAEKELDKIRCKRCGRCCEIPNCPPDSNGICKCCKEK